MKFSKLMIQGWRQFDSVDIEFHPRLTIITGANGAGKSSILRILSQHYGWPAPFLSTPEFRDGVMQYLTGLVDLFSKKDIAKNTVGVIEYTNDVASPLTVPMSGGVTYSIGIQNAQPVPGLHISSHRPVQNYQSVSNIPTVAMRADHAFSIYYQETVNRYQNSYTQFGPTYRMKEALISMATFGPGNQYVERNEIVAKTFEDFKGVLSKILPRNIGFKDINVRIPDVVVVTSTGNFVIDAASGGIMAIIDLAWQIFLYSRDKNEFVVTIDEPENHLHPSMQRTLLRNLIDAFPAVQFIIATHSPFMVSSVRDSLVFVLGYHASEMDVELQASTRIRSIKLDRANKAGTASEILRDVLGVPVTLPEWAEEDLKRISSEFQIDNLNSKQISLLRSRLDEAGLGEYYPEALRYMVND